MEFWIADVPIPGRTAVAAERAELAGWDGLVLPDTQCVAGDPFVELALAARQTTRLHLATCVTNPITRHPSVAASTAATVQLESGGRMHLGMGRGDSSLAHIGVPAASVTALGAYVDTVRTYLAGDEVAVAGAPASKIRWLPRPGMPTVPVEIAATGPRVIQMAATAADGVWFAAGADPGRLAGLVELVQRTREAAGRTRTPFAIAATVAVACLPDPSAARDLIRGTTASFARFSAMHGEVTADAPTEHREALATLGRDYDMNQHGWTAAPHTTALSDQFIDRFSVAGSTTTVIARLADILATGIQRLIVLPRSLDSDSDLAERSVAALSAEVLPALRELAL
ncbi:TIGR03842 family LLM class F420-dependent oxidoreductase [Fodinicola feengrottensis]|uniref:TIGR03842 family LLM class F420-dependent oxidoreductase n=1 Tax=Fodinicola feengrottensis TaxID=435914 RepID=A0ABN2GI35_9ACTN